jgi:2-polyprenyl-6-methoxyphenol hydroxylase-like FAD-dependent oxidoreductase
VEARVDVAIVGAGFAGLALACLLTERGLRTVVVERRAGLPSSGAAITLQPNGLAALEEVGVLELVEYVGSRMRRVSMRDTHDRELGVWDYGELDHPNPYLVGVRRHALLTLLAERLVELGGEAPQFGCAFEELLVEEDGIVHGLRHGGGELLARCTVGADGAGSAVRAALGIRAFASRPDPYVVGIGARPRQLGECDALMYLGRGYANGVLSAGQGAYFWDHADRSVRDAVDARDFARWLELYRRRVPCGRQVTAGLGSFEDLTVLRGRMIVTAERPRAGAVLLGDAAGTVHPHAGQGANLAFEEAVALADVLAETAGDEPVPAAVLARYSRPRRWRRRAAIARSALSARTLDAPSTAWRMIRTGMFAAGRIGPVRRALLCEQAGVGFAA